MSPGGTPLSTSSTSGVDERKNGIQTGPALYQMIRNGRAFSGNERNCCFLNLGNGTFADVSSVSGFDFPDDGRAVALCDWDLDGDLDVWTANRTGPQVRFLRNDLQTSNHFLSIRLEGRTCNRDAIGARVEVQLGDSGHESDRRLIKTLRAGEGFLSQSSKSIHFGLGPNTEILEILVRWPGGEEERFIGIESDRQYRIVEGSEKAEEWNPPTSPNGDKSLVPDQSRRSPAMTRARVVPANPIPLPSLEYETLDGKNGLLDTDEIEQPVLVNLWASWCQPCVRELQEWNDSTSRFRDAGVKVLALSVDPLDTDKKEPSTSTKDFLDKIGYTGDAGWATEALIEKIRLVRQHLYELHVPMSVPTSLLIDSRGRLAALYRGPVSVDQLIDDISHLPKLHSGPTALPLTGRWHTNRALLQPIDIAWRLVDHGYLDDSVSYLTTNDLLLKDSPHFHRLLLRVANKLLARGDAKIAISYYRRAMKIHPDYRDAQNNLAWVLATHPDNSIRDGKEALTLITAAVEQSPANAFTLLDTLSAAYAEVGQFDKAVATAQQAVDFATSAGQLDFAKMLEERLRLYEAKQPFRE